MGILINDLKLLWDAKTRGASFDRVLTLGRLSVNIQRHDLDAWLMARGLRTEQDVSFMQQYGTSLNGDDLLRLLGAKQVDSMDNSDFERASIVHDLNHALPPHLVESYDIVIDGGTLEHVFNFPQALQNAMSAVKVGGRLFLAQQAEGACGHGFYQFSPELFYQAFTPMYGFELQRLLVYELLDEHRVYTTYRPGETKRKRVYVRTSNMVLLLVEALKIGSCNQLFSRPPQQFDYYQKWHSDIKSDSAPIAQNEDPKLTRSPATKSKTRRHSFLHDLPWYAKFQARRQARRRQRKESRLYHLSNSELYSLYLFAE